jgi:flagellar protein FlgJ
MASISMPLPTLSAQDALSNAQLSEKPKLSAAGHEKAKAAAQDFESMFLNTMFQQMFSGVSGEGPMGGSGATGVWRSFLTDQYAKTFAKAGGIGLSSQVYSALLARQGVSQ